MGVAISHKVKYFVWLVLKDRVAVKDSLQKIGILHAKGNMCPICNEGKEDSGHICVHCDQVYMVWTRWQNYGI